MRNIKAVIGTLIVGLASLALVPMSQAQAPPGKVGGFDAYGNAYPAGNSLNLNVNAWSFPGCFAPGSTVTISIATPGVISVPNNCIVGQEVFFNTTGALPTGLTAGTTYYVITAGLSASSFEVSATAGGSAVNTSGTQSGVQTANSGFSNGTTAYTAAITTNPVPPNTVVPGHCSLIWQTSNTSGTIKLGLNVNNATATAVVLDTMHYGSGGATIAQLYTSVGASASFATPTDISAATTATTANTSYGADVDFLVESGSSPTTVSINALSSSASYTIYLMPGSKCTVGT